jgi:hypothetical protein
MGPLHPFWAPISLTLLCNLPAVNMGTCSLMSPLFQSKGTVATLRAPVAGCTSLATEKTFNKCLLKEEPGPWGGGMQSKPQPWHSCYVTPSESFVLPGPVFSTHTVSALDEKDLGHFPAQRSIHAFLQQYLLSQCCSKS